MGGSGCGLQILSRSWWAEMGFRPYGSGDRDFQLLCSPSHRGDLLSLHGIPRSLFERNGIHKYGCSKSYSIHFISNKNSLAMAEITTWSYRIFPVASF